MKFTKNLKPGDTVRRGVVVKAGRSRARGRWYIITEGGGIFFARPLKVWRVK